MYVYVLMSIIIIINCSKKCTLNSYQKHTFVCPFFSPYITAVVLNQNVTYLATFDKNHAVVSSAVTNM